MHWSEKQKAIFTDVAEGAGNTNVQARAGCGKTTTIVESLKYVPAPRRSLLTSFGKDIADELALRTAGIERANVSTLHSLGMRTVRKTVRHIKLDKWRTANLIDQVAGEEDRRAQSVIRRVVDICKGTLGETEEDIIDAIQDYDIDTSAHPSFEALCNQVARVLRLSAEDDGTVDFSDMVWLPYKWDLKPAKFDNIFVDERQDMNAAQLDLAIKAASKTRGRIFTIGDDRQAIYGFRGAGGANAGNTLKKLQAKTLLLNVTYRCPRRIVELARQYVPDFEAAPEAPDGHVCEVDTCDGAEPGDVVISRANAPLVKWCLKFLRQGRKADILGKDLGGSLSGFIKASRKKTIPDLLSHVDKWEREEVERLTAQKRKPDNAMDRAETLRVLIDGHAEVSDVLDTIERLFKNTPNEHRVLFTSTHKAKGMEWDRVWVLRPTYLRHDELEEQNLFYVAVTRSRDALYLCDKA